MKHKLFKDDKFTDAAHTLSMETRSVLRPIYERLVQDGYSVREVAHVMEWVVKDLEMDAVLAKQ